MHNKYILPVIQWVLWCQIKCARCLVFNLDVYANIFDQPSQAKQPTDRPQSIQCSIPFWFCKWITFLAVSKTIYITLRNNEITRCVLCVCSSAHKSILVRHKSIDWHWQCIMPCTYVQLSMNVFFLWNFNFSVSTAIEMLNWQLCNIYVAYLSIFISISLCVRACVCSTIMDRLYSQTETTLQIESVY